MVITKQQALDIMDNPIEDKPTGVHHRWSNEYRVIFLHTDGLHYQFFYQRGTGDSGERPFEYEDSVTCKQVVEVERTVRVWVPSPGK